MSVSYKDYFCNFCGSLLCLSNSKFGHASHYQTSNMELFCFQCKSSSEQNKAFIPVSFIPLRQILKAEIIRDAEQWANASTTTEQCPKCNNDKAYYLQLQTRSADEPMSTYYRCCKCAHNWADIRLMIQF